MGGTTVNRQTGRADRETVKRSVKLQTVELPEVAASALVKETPKAPEAPQEQSGTYVYIGPSIPHGILKENAIYKGTRSEILAFLGNEIAKYPKIKMLIVPVSHLPEQRQKLSAGGNALSHTYRELREALRK